MMRALVVAGLLGGLLESVGGTAGAIEPPQPATCAYSLGGISGQAALGTAYYSVALVPAVAYQSCTTSASVFGVVLTTGGADAAGVAPDGGTWTQSVTFYPNRPHPVATFGWGGFDGCTTVAEPVHLLFSSATNTVTTAVETSRPCAEYGVSRSGFSPDTSLSADANGYYAAGLAPTPTGTGYRIVESVGNVSSYGSAPVIFGSDADTESAVGITAAPSGDGDWVVAGDGGVFTSGSAVFHGSLGGVHLNAPIVGMAADPATGGYWLVGADGGVFAFDAPFHGSLGNVHLNAPIVGMAADPATGGYWLVGADGGVFAFDAPYLGSLGSVQLNAPVSAMAPSPDGKGYWLLGSDGGVFTYGDARYYGNALTS